MSKATLKKIGWGIVAALSTPEAVKAEKSLAAIVVTRVAVLVPAAGFLADALLKALGA